MKVSISASESGNLLSDVLSGFEAMKNIDPTKTAAAITENPHQPTRYLTPSPAKSVNRAG
jgi:hypothetical protein